MIGDNMTEKGPGDIKYGGGKAKNMKKMPDGNPYPYEHGEMAIDGVADNIVVESKGNQPSHSKEPHFRGEDGKG